jgi:hypothetical protein
MSVCVSLSLSLSLSLSRCVYISLSRCLCVSLCVCVRERTSVSTRMLDTCRLQVAHHLMCAFAFAFAFCLSLVRRAGGAAVGSAGGVQAALPDHDLPAGLLRGRVLRRRARAHDRFYGDH